MERYSGITAALCLISEAELIYCFAFSGELRLLYGSRNYFRFLKKELKRYRIAGVVWLKGVYPYLSKWIEKIPMLAGKIITWCLIIFMAADSLVSAAALMRQDQREKNIPASNVVQQWLDENYDDETLYKIYPKAKKPKKVDKSENITYSNTRNGAAL